MWNWANANPELAAFVMIFSFMSAASAFNAWVDRHKCCTSCTKDDCDDEDCFCHHHKDK